MKILTVTYSAKISGGANRTMLAVLEKLKYEYGHSIHVLIPSQGDLQSALENLEISYSIVPYSCLSVYKGYGPKNLLKYVWMHIREYKVRKRAKTLAEKLKNEHYDVIYTNEIMCFMGAFLSKYLNLPHVWHFRSHAPGTWLPCNAPHIFKYTEGRILAISSFIADFAKGISSEEKVIMVMDGVETTDNQLYKDYKVGKTLHLLHCGRIDIEKRQDLSLKALNYLINRGIRNICLHFAGSLASASNNGYYQGLLDYVKDNHLDNNVVWEGEVKDMQALRNKMNIELMCSNAEPFGRVTVEGMRAGLVVIGSNSGGTRDIIQENVTGLLFKPGDAQDLADKIESIYKDESLAQHLSKNGFDYCQTHFTIEQNAKEVNDALILVIKEHCNNI